MRRTVSILLIISFMIYGLQIIIFHDPETTAFYIFQDMAFMPFTIAIATIVVGEVMDAREKRERMEKTRMLTSNFFTEMGVSLMRVLISAADYGEGVQKVFGENMVHDDQSLLQAKDVLHRCKVHVSLTKEVYEAAKKIIMERRTTLLVISSNPLLLDHEDFTEMLWSIFHLIDEFQLRNNFNELTEEDRHHLENDFSNLLKGLLVCWTSNMLFVKETYPNFYNTAMNKMALRQQNGCATREED